MVFRELKNGYVVYAFSRKDMSCVEGKVINVSLPRFENKLGQTPCSVVDVTVEIGGKGTTYVFPDNGSKAYSGEMMFAIDRGDVVSEVKAVKRASEQCIAEYEKHKEIVGKCDVLLGELDVEFKEKRELESRLEKMERMMERLLEGGLRGGAS